MCHTTQVLYGPVFTPELMVVSDIQDGDLMRKMYRKFLESEEKKWAEDTFYNAGEKNMNLLRPPRVLGDEL